MNVSAGGIQNLVRTGHTDTFYCSCDLPRLIRRWQKCTSLQNHTGKELTALDVVRGYVDEILPCMCDYSLLICVN